MIRLYLIKIQNLKSGKTTYSAHNNAPTLQIFPIMEVKKEYYFDLKISFNF